MGYTVHYTKKNPPKDEPAFHRKEFATRENAEAFVAANPDLIYWSQIVSNDPKSVKEKVVVVRTPELDDETKWTKKVGHLETFYETGMECVGLMLSEEGVHGAPNPDFDPTKPEDGQNFEYFGSYEAINPIERHCILEINGILYAMIYDREFASEDGHRMSFYPRGFTRKEIVELFNSKTKATLYTPVK